MKKIGLFALVLLALAGSVFAQTPPGAYTSPASGSSTGSGISQVASLPTTCTAGQQFLITSSGQIVTCSATNVFALPGAPGTVNPTAYGAKYDAHFNSAPSFINTSNIVTCAGCNFTGTDLFGRPIAKVGQVAFGSNATTDISQATSVFITPECVIQSIDSATQIHMGTVAVPANPCNATASTTASGFLFWGDLDSNTTGGGAQTAANDPIFGAWTAAATNCLPYHHPAGVTFVERQEWNTYPVAAVCGTANALVITRQGFTITGEGSNASIVIPTPNFNPTNECTGPNASSIGCFASLPNPTLHDWQIWGGGNSAGGLTGKAGVLVFGLSPGVNFEIDRMQFNGWGAATTGFYGLNIGNGVASGVSGGTLSKTNVEAFGYYTCYIAPGTTGTFTATIYANALWCTVGATTLTVNAGIFSSVNGLYGWTLHAFSSTGGVNGGALGSSFSCQSGSFCNSTNDNMPYNGTVNSANQFQCIGGISPTRCNLQNDTLISSLTGSSGVATAGDAIVNISNSYVQTAFAVFSQSCTAPCLFASSGGTQYTAATTGYTNSSGQSTIFSPTDSFTGFGNTLLAGLTGTGPCATFSTQSGFFMTGIVTCTAAAGAATITVNPNFTAPHGFYCSASDQTTAADTFKQTSSSTTTCTLTSAAVAQNDVLTFNLVPY